MVEHWKVPAIERADPDRIAGERTALEQRLDYHRATLLMKCAGLTAEQLRLRPVPPSTLSLLGLVRHLTEVERWWFRMHAGPARGDGCSSGEGLPLPLRYSRDARAWSSEATEGW